LHALEFLKNKGFQNVISSLVLKGIVIIALNLVMRVKKTSPKVNKYICLV